METPTWNVTPQRFRSQIAGLVRMGYLAQPLSKVLEWNRKGRPIPANWFVITFDDVYENVYTEAWPFLREEQIPATLFLATAYLDSTDPFPFDDWRHSGQAGVSERHWKPITTSQCLEMSQSGLIELGAHTHKHEDFRNRPDDLYHDLLACKSVLFERFGVENPTFAFPYGTRSTGFSGPILADAARRAGLACSLTTEDEQVVSGTDPFDWGRFTAEEYDTPRTLAAKLDGWFTRLKFLWTGRFSRRVNEAKDLGIIS
jgi:peptidoglycan/xylan/chitin deacetylase (PgdA/CDA1 family)